MVVVRLFILLFFSVPASAAVKLSIDGMIAKANIGLITRNTSTAGIGISIDLGSYVQVSYEHGQMISYEEGFMETEGSTESNRIYASYKSRVHQISNGINLILILYGGDTVVPYIFGGIVQKQYTIQTKLADKVQEDSGSAPAPAGGAALVIRVSQRFSLKFTYKVSPGIRVENPSKPKEAKSVLDEEIKVGIQYTIAQ